jgi:3-oxoacyl-[acyl-carrier-protein] synthase II
MVLEDFEHATQRGARIYAELIGYGSSCDHAHLTNPDSQGQWRALRQALNTAAVNVDEIDYINAHGTATIEGDTSEIQALKLLLQSHAEHTWVSATKSMHGHLLGGAGALEALITTLAVHTQRMPPTAFLDDVAPQCVGVRHVVTIGQEAKIRTALSNSFAFGGSNACLVIRSI